MNWDNESEAASGTQQADDCCSLSLFQKYNMLYQKYFEDDEKRNMCTNHETTEYLECHSSPLFYDEVVLRSSSTNSYGLDPNIIERPLATIPVEAELFFSWEPTILSPPFRD